MDLKMIGRTDIPADVTVSRNGRNASDEGVLELGQRSQFGTRFICLASRLERSNAHEVQETA